MVCSYLDEFVETKDKLKQYFALFGPIQIAQELHLWNILSSNGLEVLLNIQGLTKNHLASVLVDQLSHDMKDINKYHALLGYLKEKNSHVYYEIEQSSKLVQSGHCTVKKRLNKFTCHLKICIQFNSLFC